MATVYLADNYSTPWPDVSNSAGLVTRPFAFTIAAALVINDTIKLTILPGIMGICFVDFDIEIPDVDTGESPAVTWDVGDSISATRFVSGSTVGQSAGRIYSAAPSGGAIIGSLPCNYNPNGAAANHGNDDLILKVHTAPATSVTSGKIIGWARYVQYGVGPLTFGNEPS